MDVAMAGISNSNGKAYRFNGNLTFIYKLKPKKT